jgi:hypothetical protein
MILFVTDQMAGAEYILPLLKKWRGEGRNDWSVVASSRSADRFRQNDISYLTIDVPSSEIISDIFERHKPKIVIMSSSSKSVLEGTFKKMAVIQKVLTVQFIDYWSNYRKRFELMESLDGPTHLFPDVILTLDSQARGEMLQEGFEDNLIRVIGQPYFEEQMLRYADVSGKGERLLLLTQPVRKHYSDELGYDETTFIKGCFDVIEGLRIDGAKIDVLIHPDENPDAYRYLITRRSLTPRIIQGAVNLKEYRVVVGMFSSMMVQSFLARVNTICFTPTLSHVDMNALSRLGYAERCTTQTELRNAITACLDEGHFLNQNGYEKMRGIVCGSVNRLEQYIDSTLTSN